MSKPVYIPWFREILGIPGTNSRHSTHHLGVYSSLKKAARRLDAKYTSVVESGDWGFGCIQEWSPNDEDPSRQWSLFCPTLFVGDDEWYMLYTTPEPVGMLHLDIFRPGSRLRKIEYQTMVLAETEDVAFRVAKYRYAKEKGDG